MRREEVDGGVHRTRALLESEVGVVEGDKTDEADEAVASPDEERELEPVADPKDGRE